MDYLTENMVEEQERKRRKERIEHMRRQKQLQMKRRERLKFLITRRAGVIVAVLVMVIVGIAFINKTNDQLAVQTEHVEVTEKKSWFSFGKDKKAQDGANVASEDISQAESEEQYAEVIETEPEKLAEKTEAYEFEITADTAAIYQEEIISTNAVLIDESTDTIIAAKGEKERISPASMTKVLTILVAAENLTKEQLEDTFVMTREITDYGYINDCSAVGFLEGEEIVVKDLFYGTILPSGSDAAVGLATYIAGSHEAFVEMMNDKLEELGLGNSSHVTNCVGLYDENHYSTVYDMAVIMKAAIQNDFCKEVLAQHNYTTAATTEHPEGINISNWFLRRIEDKDTGGEVLCAKTGYVRQSKSCAVSYGTFANGKPYICVTAGSSSSWRCIYDHVEIYNEYIAS